MSATLGSALVLIALAAAAFGGAGGMLGVLTGRADTHKLVRGATWTFAVAMIGANLWMVAALVGHDFSVKYVAMVGSRATPAIFSAVSLWSALEGSILFWGAILGGYLIAFLYHPPTKDRRYETLALSVMLLVGCFFALLIAGPANPFSPGPMPVPTDGPGPNPLLQNHLLMVVHPPALYLGYVGMTIPFGLAVAMLIDGRPLEAALQGLRRWLLVSWGFLTLGIILGAWWAYAVLGWGGYWSWDPVENASFLPWLSGAAFLHSSLITERRKLMRGWTVALILLTFWLTMLGTFMTRSGIFNSVHAFTQSEIGPTFLGFLAVTAIVCIGLVTLRSHTLAAEQRVKGAWSKEIFLLGGNLLLAAFTFTVFLGTVFPLVTEAVEGRRISVGEPYFNRFAVPLAMLILLFMAVGPSLPWEGSERKGALNRLQIPLGVMLLTAAILGIAGIRNVQALMAFSLAAFAGVVTLRELFAPAWDRARNHGEAFSSALWTSMTRGRRRFGGYVVHLGLVILCVGVTASSAYPHATFGTVQPGGTIQIGKETLTFVGLEEGQEPHRSFLAANFELPTGERMSPRLNYYPRSNDPIGSPAIRSGFVGDLYLSLMTWDAQTGAATYRAWSFPLVGWIWATLPLMLLGTFVAAWPERQRKEATATAAKPEPAIGGAS